MNRILLLTFAFAVLPLLDAPRPVFAQTASFSSSAPRSTSGFKSGPSAPEDADQSSLQPSDSKPATVSEGRALAAIQPGLERRPRNRPFRSLAITANVGTSGIGFDLATPIAPHLGIRGGAQFYNQGIGFTADGLNSNASINLRNVAVMLDVFPFHNGFHLSPGLTLNNNDHISAVLNVPGGQNFTLGNTDFTSSMSNPVSGSASVKFGNNIAPRFTLGWDDILRHRLGHVSLPAEFGFQYSAAPVVSLSLAGSACYGQAGCAPAASSSVMAAAQQEILKLQNDLSPLRFYPISTIGIRYTIGR